MTRKSRTTKRMAADWNLESSAKIAGADIHNSNMVVPAHDAEEKTNKGNKNARSGFLHLWHSWSEAGFRIRIHQQPGV